MTERVHAPGRVNLLGEHTDYSGGLVLPISIQLGITVTFEPAAHVELDAPGGERYVAAVERELAELGRPDVGLIGAVSSDLPQGAGLGSSGAFEIAVALALCSVAGFAPAPLERLARAPIGTARRGHRDRRARLGRAPGARALRLCRAPA